MPTSKNKPDFDEVHQPTNITNIKDPSNREEIHKILNIIKIRTKHLSGKDLELLKKYLSAVVE